MTTMIVEELGRIPMSPFLTATLTRAADYAAAQAHREVTLEHLLLALAEDPEASIVLKTSNVDLSRLVADVSNYLGNFEDRLGPGDHGPIVSTDLRRILEAAAAAAQQGRRREINGAIVLAAIVGDGNSPAALMLRTQGLTFEEAIRALQRASSVPPQANAPPPRPPEQQLVRPPVDDVFASARDRIEQRTGMSPPELEPALQDAPEPVYERHRGGHPAEAHDQQLAPAQDAHPPGPQPAVQHPPQPTYERSIEAAPQPRDTWMPPPQQAPAPAAPHRPPHPPLQRTPPQGQGAPVPSAARQPPGPPQPSPHLPQGAPRMPPPVTPPVTPPWSEPPGARQQHIPPQPHGPPSPDRRRTQGSGPFIGNWPLIEAGQLVENIPRRMRVSSPVVVEARIARANVKALAEGLQGGGTAFRHEVVVTKAMSVRLRAPDGGFTIETRSPETQWIENVLGLASDDYASWRWTVTPKARGRRQLQLIVSARTVGADGLTAETALPDQIVDVKVAINYGATAKRWAGWATAAVMGGIFARFGDSAFEVARTVVAKLVGG